MIPLVLSILFTLPFALLVSPDFTVGIGRQIASALSFTSNWYFILIGSSYEAQLLPQLYVHMWTLAVIIQFYVAWGALCGITVLISNAAFRDNRKKRYSSFRNALFILSVLIAVYSFIYLTVLHGAGRDLNFIYFNTLSRFFPFFLGSAAAAVWGMNSKQDAIVKKRFFTMHKIRTAAALIVAAAAIVAAMVYIATRFRFADAFIYNYGFLLTSVFTVALIYCAHGLHLLTPPAMEEPKSLKTAAALSYDIYLYHWPLLIVFSALFINQIAASLITLAVSVGVSAIMVYGVQRLLPPHKISDGFRKKKLAMIVICVFAAAALSAGAAVVAKAPVITSIEADFASGHVVQDSMGIASLKRGIEAVNTTPVVHAEGAPLQPDHLPAPVNTPPESSSQPPSDDYASQDEDDDGEPGDDDEQPEQDNDEESDLQADTTLVPPTPPGPPVNPPSPPDFGPGGIPGGVTIIGDSVPLGAQATLVSVIPNCAVDAAVNRTVLDGLSLVRSMQETGELREYVVVALATNGTWSYDTQLTSLIEAINPGHRVIVVTPFDGRSNDNGWIVNETAKWIRELPAMYDYVTVADWNALISVQQNLLAGDRVHMGGQTSMRLYADMVAEAIGIAAQKPAKGDSAGFQENDHIGDDEDTDVPADEEEGGIGAYENEVTP